MVQVAQWTGKKSSQVGIGSLVHCLPGRFLTAATTSVSVTLVKARSTQPTGAGVKIGESASAVEARTAATLLSK